ncbi:MAG TPA: XRE family transcriptional regulator [Actinotalea sp.]|nr:XRE family transcriptional regulator [Actinotalea sp.]
MDPEPVTVVASGVAIAVGAAVRSGRRRLGLTVEQLAARSGVSTGALSQIERGMGNPALGTLLRLATALGIPVAQLLDGSVAADHLLVRASERPQLVGDPGHDGAAVVRQLLSPTGGRLQMIRSEVPPHFSNEGRAYRHLGQECVVVLSGSLVVQVGETRVGLGEGDALTYDTSVPHWWANPADEPAVVLGAVTPLAF